jgi:glyoxylase-like metal-dependent hydrolase (beta-lactamase superfamily II)
MKIHAIQTGTVAVKTKQREGQGTGFRRFLNTLADKEWTDPLPIYAWVIEHPEGIIVVDTGETSLAAKPGYFPGWHPYFKLGVREWVQPEQEIGSQLRQIGISPRDIRWVVMTHLHTDHAGGLSHFPDSEIIVSQTEYEIAKGLAGRLRGYPNQHWPEWFSPQLVTFMPTALGPFPQSLSLTRAGDVYLVPTPGHTPGHLSVILEDIDQTYFFAGDTSYTEQIMLQQKVDGVAPDEVAAQETLRRVMQYVKQENALYLPSHDPESGMRLNSSIKSVMPVEKNQFSEITS